jgi:hypothetical protein
VSADGPLLGWTDGRTASQMDGHTDSGSYLLTRHLRVAGQLALWLQAVL